MSDDGYFIAAPCAGDSAGPADAIGELVAKFTDAVTAALGPIARRLSALEAAGGAGGPAAGGSDGGFSSGSDDESADGEPVAMPGPAEREIPEEIAALLKKMDIGEVTAQNDAACRPGSDDQLVTLGSLVAADFPSAWADGVTCVVPTEWHTPTGPMLSAEAYARSFREKNALVLRAIGAVNREFPGIRLVVAGGAAAAPLFEARGLPGRRPDDIDVFTIVDEEVEETQLWEALHVFATAIASATPTEINTAQAVLMVSMELREGLLTFQLFSGTVSRWNYEPSRRLKIQVILRRYPDLGSLLHAFDLAGSAVATDGTTAWLTAAASATYLTGVMPVWPHRRSISFEWRLRKYMQKGLGLAFHGYPLAVPAAGQTAMYGVPAENEFCRPTILTVNFVEELRPGVFRGGVIAESTECDYEIAAPIPPQSRLTRRRRRADNVPINALFNGIYYGARCLEVCNWSNLVALLSEAPPSLLLTGRSAIPLNSEGRQPTLSPPIVLNRDSTRRPAQVFPRAGLNAVLETITRASDPPSPGSLVKYLGASPEEAIRFTHELAELRFRMPEDEIAWVNTLVPLIERVQRRHTELLESGASQWWVVQDPGRQWTASRNPQPADPTSWYTGVNAEPRAALADETKDADGVAALADETSSDEDDPICAICHEDVVVGTLGTVLTSCGHAFHFMSSGGCSGLAPWVQRHNTCPVCRATLIPSAITGESPTVVRPTERPPIPFRFSFR